MPAPTEFSKLYIRKEQEILQLYESGIYANQLAKKYECSVDTILRILRKNGIKLFHERENYQMPQSNQLKNSSNLGSETGGRPEIYTQEVINGYADEFLIWLKDPKHVLFCDFCLDKDINPELMSEWAIKNEKFRHVYELAKKRQESRMLNGGLFGKMNSAIVKFALVNHHGYNDKKEVNVTSNENSIPEWAKQAEGQSKDLVNELIK